MIKPGRSRPIGTKTGRGSKKRASGCTLLVDADTGLIRYQIEKRSQPRAGPKKAPSVSSRVLPVSRPAAPPRPVDRRLRVFALPIRLWASKLETAGINEVTLRVPWERGVAHRDLIGPVGEYLEVVDRDPASKAFYALL